MTATKAPVRPAASRAPRPAAPATGRLLWLELRHNPMPLILPLIALLFWFDSYRPSTAQPLIWSWRTFWNMGQGHTIVDFGPFVAGMAAWAGSRDGRRGVSDLVTATVRSRWAANLTAWAATAIWAVVSYLAFTGALFAVYARQGVGGTPPWWWVAVGAVAVAAFSAAGFAVGVFFPSRFAAPLAAFGGFLAMMMSSQTGFRDTTGWAQVLPTNSNGNYEAPSGIFYPWPPDLPIARIMFLAGIAVAVLGLLGLPARAGGPSLRRAAAAVTLAGLAAAGTGVGLAAAARLGPHGMFIPALHDAASDQPIRYTPVCGHAHGVPVCLNPAYHSYLTDVTAALGPVLAEVAGLPGAPARAVQVAGGYSGGEGEAPPATAITGRPPVLRMPLDGLNLPGSSGFTSAPVPASQFAQQLQVLFMHAFVGAGAEAGTPAQQAVQMALLHSIGVPLTKVPDLLAEAGLGTPAPVSAPGQTGHVQMPAGKPVYAAARRFAALPAITRHTWLVSHLAALRSGHLTPQQLP